MNKYDCRAVFWIRWPNGHYGGVSHDLPPFDQRFIALITAAMISIFSSLVQVGKRTSSKNGDFHGETGAYPSRNATSASLSFGAIRPRPNLPPRNQRG